MRGTRSSPFSSGITTSVMTSWPSPSWTHCHSVAAVPVLRTLWPWRPSAWCRTVRIARSSSAIRMVAGAAHGAACGELQRQHHPEDGAAGLALELDGPAVVVDDLGDQCKTQAGAGRLGGHESVEQMGADLVGDAVAVVAHRHDQRQVDLAPAGPGTASRRPWRIGGGQLDLALAVAGRLAGVLHQIEEDLDELVAVAVDRRAATGS